jgi:hypothetical protein
MHAENTMEAMRFDKIVALSLLLFVNEHQLLMKYYK